MESPKLAEWLNLLAAGAVLAGLAFVACEVRQTNDIASAEDASAQTPNQPKEFNGSELTIIFFYNATQEPG